MAAIFDLPRTPMSDSVHTSTTELLDLENVAVAFGISLISCIEAEFIALFYFYFQFLAAIFDLRPTPTLLSVHISPVVFLDHKYAGLVLGFPMVPCLEAET